MSRVLSRLGASFRPPFPGLWIWAWAFFVWAQLVFPGTLILDGQFGDSDDVIHLIRALDWLQGQSWFDPHIMRIMPPEGIVTHFSRLAELPLAALMAPLLVLGVASSAAALIAAAIWPPLLLIGMFWAVRWTARSFVGDAWAGASAYIFLFAVQVIWYFTPGRVDHHGLSLLLLALALGSVVRTMDEPDRAVWPLLAGFVNALGLAIALETLPGLMLFTGWIGLWTLARGVPFAHACRLYAFSLVGSTFGFLLATVPLADITDTNPLAFSGLYVGLVGMMGLALAGTSFAAVLRNKILRWGLGVVWPVALAGLFLALSPELLRGPYGGVDKEIAAYFLPNIVEAIPIVQKIHSLPELVSFILMCVLGLEAALQAMGERADRNGRWILLVILILVFLLLAVGYQNRFIAPAALFAVFSLTHFLKSNLAQARERLKGRKLFAAELLIILLVGPFVSVLFPAAVDGRSFSEGVLLFPASWQNPNACDRPALRSVLTLPAVLGDRPHLIMNEVISAASILFYTPHSVISAPYHTNPKGLKLSREFFHAKDPEEARRVLKESGADLVLVCGVEPVGMDLGPSNVTTVDINGRVLGAGEKVMAERLIDGETFSWLKPVHLPFLLPNHLYEVVPNVKP